MLIFITILATLIIIGAVKFYSDSNGRILPLSTRRGKEARIVLVFMLVCYLFLLGLNIYKESSSGRELIVWVAVFFLSGIIPIWRYFQDKKNKHK